MEASCNFIELETIYINEIIFEHIYLYRGGLNTAVIIVEIFTMLKEETIPISFKEEYT